MKAKKKPREESPGAALRRLQDRKAPQGGAAPRAKRVRLVLTFPPELILRLRKLAAEAAPAGVRVDVSRLVEQIVTGQRPALGPE